MTAARLDSTAKIKSNSSAPSHLHPAQSLLRRTHSPDTAERIFTEKIKNRPLLLRPTAGEDPANKRALRRHIRLRKKEYYVRKRKPQPLSAKEKRKLGVFKLSQENIKYETYGKLHALWNEYMLEVLGIVKDGTPVQGWQKKTVTAQSQGILLVSADFHGAEIEVVKSKDVGKVKLKGIVVRDTKFTFVLITQKGKIKTVPKRDTTFRYVILLPSSPPGSPYGDDKKHDGSSGEQAKLSFELHGNQFEVRPAERANRKFKLKVTDYL